MIVYKGYEIHKDGTVHNKDGSKKKLAKNSQGYYRVDIIENGVRTERVFVHRLVAELFIPKEKGKSIINHIDGDKLNNHYKNLEWSTYSDNLKHAYEIGLRLPMANRRTNTKLTVEQVSDIKKIINDGDVTLAELGRRYGVGKSTIHNIKTGKSWGNIV